MTRDHPDEGGLRPIGPNDFAGTPGFRRGIPVSPQRATGTDGPRPVPLHRIPELARKGKLPPPARSLAEELAAIEARRAQQAPPAPAPPACPICRDAGYFLMDVPFGHPSFGQLQPCACKEEEHQQLRVQAALRIGSLRLHQHQRFDTFRLDDVTIPVTEAFNAAAAYAESPQGFLVLVGSRGTGKTHLAAAICNARLATSRDAVVFAVVPDLLDAFRATFHPSSPQSYSELHERVRDCDLLVLDDIGTHAASPWAQEKLFQLVNHRYAADRPTVFTSNQPPAQIDGRIVSRADGKLFGGKPWVLIGPDRRTQAADESWASVDPRRAALQPAPRYLRSATSPYDRGELGATYDQGDED